MATIRNFVQRHPQITAWIVLAIGMVIILIWSAREVGFTAGQWAALIVTTILLAGACVWIIGWGEDEESEADKAEVEQAPTGTAPGSGEASINQAGDVQKAD